MDKLTQEQQQLILDFYFRCGDKKDVEAGRDLVASMPEAAKLYADLEETLTDLDHIKYEACPDNLVDLTIARLRLAAGASKVSNVRLHELLEQEQKAPSVSEIETPRKSEYSSAASRGSDYWRPFFQILAAAACVAVVAGILFPSLGLMRQRESKILCQRNLGAMSAGFMNMANDYNPNDSDLAGVKVKAGSPWWKIGDQGQQAHSNTRYPFMLVKGGYVDGRVFVCKGDKNATPFGMQGEKAAGLHDFSSPQNVSFSFVLFTEKNTASHFSNRTIIASDMSPVFKRIRCRKSVYHQMDEFEKIKLNEQLKQSLSANHGGRGQNILYSDGSVVYVQHRILDGDDIFTVRGVDVYTGREIPSEGKDTFLVP